MSFFAGLKQSMYFKKNASRFVKHALQSPCDVFTAAKDALWTSVQAQGWPEEARQEFENLMYMASIAARGAHEVEVLTARRGVKTGQKLEAELIFRSEQVFGNRQVFEELLRMAQDIRKQAAEADPAELADFCLRQAVKRIAAQGPELAAGTFAPMSALFTEGALVADIMDQEQP